LQMSNRVGTNPDLLPRWRNGQRTDSLQHFLILHHLANGVTITEVFAGNLAMDARHLVGDIT
jgi:hypothetical protein